MADYERIVRRLLAKAKIQVNGSSPWDIQVRQNEFYKRIITEGTLGLGESYMEGWWDCEAIDQLFHRLLDANLHKDIELPIREKISILLSRLQNMQARSRGMKVIEEHYNSQTKTILSFLDDYKQYSCAYYEGTAELNRAQVNKMELICRKLALERTDRLLDIGCGYGGFARFVAERYGCEVTGITPSQRQIDFAEKFCNGLPVAFVKSDYRAFRGSFTKIVSVGMIEHVGYKNYRSFMQMVSDCLQDEGLFLLQTIGGNTSTVKGEAWLAKYFFPNSMLPSVKQISGAAERLLVLEDLQNFGHFYDTTLMAWYRNFLNQWAKTKANQHDRYFRMWKYYFLHMAGTFRARYNQLWQFVFSKHGIPGGYLGSR